MKAGQLAYYPAHFPHTLRTVSDDPAHYLMLKWQGGSKAKKTVGFGRFDALAPLAAPSPEKGFRAQLLFEGATATLEKLHGHASTLPPGAGYSPHADAHDVAIVVLEGEVETLGESVTPFGVIFHPAGESHGISNPASSPARYAVFEFHGEGADAAKTSANARGARGHQRVGPSLWAKPIRQLLKAMTSGRG
jgi:hypothetical protein